MVALSVLTAVLLLASTFQAAYSKDPWTKSQKFKAGTVIVAGIAGVLMVWTTWRDQQSQARLEQAITGISQTIFPTDITLEFQGAYDFHPELKGFLDDGFVMISVVPRTSTHFCEWGVTHTPTEDSAVGMIFEGMNPVPAEDLPVGVGDPAVQAFKFELSVLVTNGQMRVVGTPSPIIPVAMTRNMSLDEYVQSQFIAELVVPGRVRHVERAVLKVKGKPIPLYLFAAGNQFIGSTVFRPTWERYCQSRRRAAGTT